MYREGGVHAQCGYVSGTGNSSTHAPAGTHTEVVDSLEEEKKTRIFLFGPCSPPTVTGITRAMGPSRLVGIWVATVVVTACVLGAVSYTSLTAAAHDDAITAFQAQFLPAAASVQASVLDLSRGLLAVADTLSASGGLPPATQFQRVREVSVRVVVAAAAASGNRVVQRGFFIRKCRRCRCTQLACAVARGPLPRCLRCCDSGVAVFPP